MKDGILNALKSSWRAESERSRRASWSISCMELALDRGLGGQLSSTYLLCIVGSSLVVPCAIRLVLLSCKGAAGDMVV